VARNLAIAAAVAVVVAGTVLVAGILGDPQRADGVAVRAPAALSSGGSGASGSAAPNQIPGTGEASAPAAKPSLGESRSAVGTGTFVTADATGKPVGSGTVRRYKVQIEQGIGVSAEQVAAEVAGFLADPRGWTTDGHNGFQLVSHGASDFQVKIASPATVDRICATGGLNTHGEVNC
jgi:hypothetical protein